QYRPVTYIVWAVVVLLIFPFYMFSQKELAPAEDQSVVFGIIQASANSTMEQTRRYAQAVQDVYKSFPEYQNTFQLITPGGGFGGIVTKPWSARKKSTSQIQMESAAGLGKIPGVRVISTVPPALPGGGDFPVDFVIASTAEPQQLVEFPSTLMHNAY